MSEADFAAWEPALRDLARRVRAAVGEALREARRRGDLAALGRAVQQGAGDVTYGLDVPAEAAVEAWHRETAARTPLSLLTEDAGWRHLGPDGRGGVRPLEGFDHGGPRVTVDPVDGTRGLMHDLRPAWTVVAFAGSGPAQPRLADVTGGLLSELPTSRGGAARLLLGAAGRATLDEEEGQGAAAPSPLVADGQARVDGGFFPFFRYEPALRPLLAQVEAAFFGRLAEREGADVSTCWDDQYISNGAHMALLALGTYRFVADLRPWAAQVLGRPTTCAKPFDVAGGVAVARAAGCVVEDPAGAPLDVPLDATTPVAFVGYANAATAERLRPHLLAALSPR